jgi:hypothetical protein
MCKPSGNQNRTAIIYFGETKQDYLRMSEEKGHRELLEYLQPLLKVQLQQAQHHEGCSDFGRYTVHSQRTRQLQGLLGILHTG